MNPSDKLLLGFLLTCFAAEPGGAQEVWSARSEAEAVAALTFDPSGELGIRGDDPRVDLIEQALDTMRVVDPRFRDFVPNLNDDPTSIRFSAPGVVYPELSERYPDFIEGLIQGCPAVAADSSGSSWDVSSPLCDGPLAQVVRDLGSFELHTRPGSATMTPREDAFVDMRFVLRQLRPHLDGEASRYVTPLYSIASPRRELSFAVPDAMPSGSLRFHARLRWGDCLSGCLHSHTWIFELRGRERALREWVFDIELVEEAGDPIPPNGAT